MKFRDDRLDLRFFPSRLYKALTDAKNSNSHEQAGLRVSARVRGNIATRLSGLCERQNYGAEAP